MTRPVQFTWEGDGFRPANSYWAGVCDKLFVVGVRYGLIEHNERSTASHNFYFASLNELWSNLPESEADRFPTVEHMRKYALIKCGYRNERTFVASSKAEALRIAQFLRPVDEYAIVLVKDCVVIEWTAQSQSYKAMGKKAFQDSKQAVLDWCADLIGVDIETLTQNAGKAA